MNEIHSVLEIVFMAAIVVWVVGHGQAFSAVTSSLGNAYGSGIASLEGI